MIPKLFSDFYDSTIAEVAKARAKREADAIKKTMASEERMAELSEIVTRGRLAKEFVKGDFWIDFLGPFLRSESVLRPAVVKDGDARPDKRAYISYLIGSGKVIILAKLVTTLEEWQVLGEEAGKIILLEAEKRRRVSA